MRDDRSYRIRKVVGKVGEYRLGNDLESISIALAEKPNIFHRLMMRLFFGIKWIDYDGLEDKSILIVKQMSQVDNKNNR